MITIGCISNLKKMNLDNIDEVWFIVRSLKGGAPVIKDSKGRILDVYHVPQLSPSPDLFHAYLQWKQNGEWNQECFTNKYVPQFLQEMHGEEERKYLNILYSRAKTKSILLLCFCPDESLCHRSIVFGIMQGIFKEKGMNVECIGNDYSSYYEMYRKLDNKFLANVQKHDWIKENTFYLLVAGSRTFQDYALLCQKCDEILSTQVSRGKQIVIVEGDANGADKLAGRYAQERGYQLVKMPADWDKLGKSAGFKRNENMHLKIASPMGDNSRGCICFWDGQSRGTRHNFMLAEDYKNPIRVFNYICGKWYTQEKIHEIAEEVRQESAKYRRY